MKIKTNELSKAYFKDIPYGDLFANACGELYLKTRKATRDTGTAISVRNGAEYPFTRSERVIKVKEIEVTFDV